MQQSTAQEKNIYNYFKFTSPRAARSSRGSAVPLSASTAFSAGCADTAVGVIRRLPRAEQGVLVLAAARSSLRALVLVFRPTRLQ